MLARTSSSNADSGGATEHWRHLARLDPLNARFAGELMRALAASGNRAGAPEHFKQHEALLRADLDAPPEPELSRLAEDIRAGRGLVTAGILSPATTTPPPPQAEPAAPERRRASDVPAAPPARRRPSAFLSALGLLAARVGHGRGETRYAGRNWLRTFSQFITRLPRPNQIMLFSSLVIEC